LPRTTIDIDAAVLRELERRKRRDGKPLGALVSELLAAALRHEDESQPPFSWTTRRMGARVDLGDKEAVRRTLDER
jgi:hypothetical protein